VVENVQDQSVLAEVRREVEKLTDAFPLYAWKRALPAHR